MIYIMIIIGGITRLTGSGLSIVEWELIGGSLPPLSDADWQEKFDLYKQFPQYKIVNTNMSVDEFKSIFWWEYIHRMWGRLIGLAFIIPFIIFLLKKQIDKKLLPKLIIILILGALQGVVGWIMVKSGLENQPWVSPYKLAIHLLLALIVYSYVFWTALSILLPSTGKSKKTLAYTLLFIIIHLLAIQLFYGGLMSGWRAALHYPTFPTMNGQWIPEQLWIFNDWYENLFENVAMIQFIHRNIGYLIFAMSIVTWISILKSKVTPLLKNSAHLFFVIVLLQVLLGIGTLVMSKADIPIVMGLLHQGTAVLLLTVLLFIFYQVKNTLNK